MKTPIKPLQKDHLETVLAIRKRAILHYAPRFYSPTLLAEWANKDKTQDILDILAQNNIWGIFVEDKLVGWGSIAGQEIVGLYIDPEYAAQGLGSTIFHYLENELIKQGVTILKLNASFNAVQFYEKHGYHVVGMTEDKLSKKMQREL